MTDYENNNCASFVKWHDEKNCDWTYQKLKKCIERNQVSNIKSITLCRNSRANQVNANNFSIIYEKIAITFQSKYFQLNKSLGDLMCYWKFIFHYIISCILVLMIWAAHTYFWQIILCKFYLWPFIEMCEITIFKTPAGLI